MAHALMLQGTGSDVGKSVLTAGLCRVLTNRGLSVRPFKAQNMSNNAAVTADGGEIGRAQWLQALACRTAPVADMNPVLLKPETDTGAQIVVQGRVRGRAEGRAYQSLKAQLMDAVMESYHRLAADADWVIAEGAGSPAEINLRQNDIANMGIATRANVPVVLVGDIDRGGVIASLVGTHQVLDEEDRAMIIGFLINRFRGDVSLFDDGLAAISAFTNWPCFGVVPHLECVTRLPAEDSVVLERSGADAESRFKVAVPITGRIANFDDLDPLAAEPGVSVVMVPPAKPIPDDADLIVIPGSKSTLSDLRAFNAQGWSGQVRDHAKGGKPVVGICGGYQVLGKMVRDPDGLEGPPGEAPGLGLLDVETVMTPEKRLTNVSAHSTVFDTPLDGYEIHLGETTGPDCTRPFAMIGGRPDGAVSADGRVFGTYLHGLFGCGIFRQAFLARYGVASSTIDHRDRVDQALDELAGALADVLDIDAMMAMARDFRR